MTATTTKTSHDLARESFNRCNRSDGFFDTFYTILKSSNADIAAMFLKTDFTKQNGLLRVALELMLMFERDGDAARQALAKTRQSHNQDGLNIRPELYDVWLDCLMEACAVHDTEFDTQTEEAWREVLLPSINYLRSGYREGFGDAECMSYLRSIDPNLETVAKAWCQLPVSVRTEIVSKATRNA
jgi:hemoglobin-like flavoprotein